MEWSEKGVRRRNSWRWGEGSENCWSYFLEQVGADAISSGADGARNRSLAGSQDAPEGKAPGMAPGRWGPGENLGCFSPQREINVLRQRSASDPNSESSGLAPLTPAPGVWVPLRKGVLGGLCSLKESGCTKSVPSVTSGWSTSLHFKSETPPTPAPEEGGPSTVGRQSGSTPPEPAWVYTVRRARAGLFLHMAARWPTRRLLSFPTQSTPPPEDAKDFGGADVICAYSRQAERAPRSPGGRWCLLSAPPPWFPAQRIGPASTAESAGAEGRQRGLWGGRGGSPTQLRKQWWKLGECRLAGSGVLGRAWDRSG